MTWRASGSERYAPGTLQLCCARVCAARCSAPPPCGRSMLQCRLCQLARETVCRSVHDPELLEQNSRCPMPPMCSLREHSRSASAQACAQTCTTQLARPSTVACAHDHRHSPPPRIFLLRAWSCASCSRSTHAGWSLTAQAARFGAACRATPCRRGRTSCPNTSGARYRHADRCVALRRADARTHCAAASTLASCAHVRRSCRH